MRSEDLARGIRLFNHAEFFEAHEVLEDVWRAAPAEEKKFLQGLVQVAVAFHHHSTGNRVGMRSVMERAMRNLAGSAGDFTEIDKERLQQSLNEWKEAMDKHQPLPPLPHIELEPGTYPPGSRQKQET